MTISVHSGLCENDYILGRVHGPYTSLDGTKDVIVVLYNEDSTVKSNTIIPYKRYIEEYDKGLHRYEYCNFPLPKIVEEQRCATEERKCYLCKKSFISIRNSKFCCSSCKEKTATIAKRNNKKFDYHRQIICAIKNPKGEDCYILHDKFGKKEKCLLFIEKSKTKTIVTDDDNGIPRYRLIYNREDAARAKSVIGYKELAWVIDIGLIVSKRTYLISLKPPTSEGYIRYTTFAAHREKPYISLLVHKCVANAFIPNPENKPQVDHIDEDKTNNHYTNLRFVTPSENMLASANGNKRKETKKNGTGFAPLTPELVRYIKSLAGKMSHYRIGLETNVRRREVGRILNNEIHKNII